jgi:hypothetical protein
MSFSEECTNRTNKRLTCRHSFLSYANKQTKKQDDSASYEDEEMMGHLLPASTYRISFVNLLGATDDTLLTECYPLFLEIAIVPKRTMEDRYLAYTASPGVCQSGDGIYPELNLTASTTATGPVTYDSTATPAAHLFHVRSLRSSLEKYTTNFVHGWNVTIPAVRYVYFLCVFVVV